DRHRGAGAGGGRDRRPGAARRRAVVVPHRVRLRLGRTPVGPARGLSMRCVCYAGVEVEFTSHPQRSMIVGSMHGRRRSRGPTRRVVDTAWAGGLRFTAKTFFDWSLAPAISNTLQEEPISTELRVNDRIRVGEVRLVGPNGEQVGIVRI